jgi:hypothetical protein
MPPISHDTESRGAQGGRWSASSATAVWKRPSPLGTAVVAVGDDQQTSAPHIYAAGEMTGIAGAAAAAAEGTIAGYSAAGRSQHLPADVVRERDSARDFARRLATAHPVPPGWHGWLDDDTTICRCEGTTVAQLRASHSADQSRRATKLNTRAGLGPCQGRFCETSVDSLCTSASNSDDRDADTLSASGVHNRPIASPIRLGELAAQADHGHADDDTAE